MLKIIANNVIIEVNFFNFHSLLGKLDRLRLFLLM